MMILAGAEFVTEIWLKGEGFPVIPFVSEKRTQNLAAFILHDPGKNLTPMI
jgi:hypothetical protein